MGRSQKASRVLPRAVSETCDESVELLHRLAPVLRGPGFADAWQTFESTLPLDLLPEPARSLVPATHQAPGVLSGNTPRSDQIDTSAPVCPA